MGLQSTATAANLPRTGTPTDVIPDVPLLALYDEARVLCGMSQKEMAINAGVNEGTFSQALRGEGSRTFNPEWIDKQPHGYKVALTTLMQRKFGVTKEAARAVVVHKLFAAIEELLTLTEVDL